MTILRHGLQSHAAPAENRLSDEGEPRPGRAADARLVGRDGHLQAPARGRGRPSAVDPARRAAVRQRQHPHGPRPQQGPQGRRREVALDGRLRRGLRAGLGLPRPADRAQVDKSSARAARSTCAAMDPIEMRRAAESTPASTSTSSAQEFQRLGVFGDWDNPYLTMAPAYEAVIAREFGALRRSRLVYKGLKPVHWCMHCKTALAEAEVEYEDQRTPSVYVKFPLVTVTPPLASVQLAGQPAFAIIWTTTPWTLPANLAIAVHPDLTTPRSTWAVTCTWSRPRGSRSTSDCSARLLRARPSPWRLRYADPIWSGPCTSTRGSTATADRRRGVRGDGCGHRAWCTSRPATARKTTISAARSACDIYNPVDDDGRFIAEIEHFAGQTVWEANPKIIALLKTRGALVAEVPLTHTYPHCWRCKNPTLFRATEQWFIALDQRRAARAGARGHPQRRAVDSRLGRGAHLRHDRAPSGLDASRASACGACRSSPSTARAAGASWSKSASSSTWRASSGRARAPTSGMRARRASCCRRARTAPSAAATASARRRTSWMSGSTRAAATPPCWRRVRTCAGPPSSTWKARISTAAGSTPRCWRRWAPAAPPYKAVLTCGFVVDGEGARCPSRSATAWSPRSSCPSTAATCSGCGPPTRTTPRTSALSGQIMDRLADAYRRIRNTFRFLLGNLADFDPRADRQPYERLEEVDRFILDRLARLIDRVVRAYEEYQFHTVFHAVHNFCAVDLSALYLDVIKDRLYTSAARDPRRRAAQTACYDVFLALTRLHGADPHVHDRGSVAPPAGGRERERAPRAISPRCRCPGSTTTSTASGIVCSRCAAKWPGARAGPGRKLIGSGLEARCASPARPRTCRRRSPPSGGVADALHRVADRGGAGCRGHGALREPGDPRPRHRRGPRAGRQVRALLDAQPGGRPRRRASDTLRSLRGRLGA